MMNLEIGRKLTLEQELESMIRIIEREFFNTQVFTVFDLYTIVPHILIVEDSSQHPNAGLMPIEEKEMMGVSVNSALLEIQDYNAILFVLGHELAHAFSGKLLEDIQCIGIAGAATEVIADLGAMWVLKLKGLSFEQIEQTISQWQKSDIFDEHKSGDHPPGAKRAEYIISAIKQLKNGLTFNAVVSNIIREELKMTGNIKGLFGNCLPN